MSVLHSKPARRRAGPGAACRAHVVILLALGLVACGGGGGGGGEATPTKASDGIARVKFVYRAPTQLDPAVQSAFPSCVGSVNPTHIHASWEGFTFRPMTAESTRWTIVFNNVPVGQINSIRINDPNHCDMQRTGAVTMNVFANSVELTTVVGTPGNGTEPGLSFSVTENGRVTP